MPLPHYDSTNNKQPQRTQKTHPTHDRTLQNTTPTSITNQIFQQQPKKPNHKDHTT
jgi:hypothetical protein